MSKYINPFTDFGFKKIFGEEPNKDLLIDFLNVLLERYQVKIKDLNYKKTEHLGATDLDRKVVFDLYCENEQGEKFIVEMQKAKQKYFKDRMLYYSTFPIQEQSIRGKEWDYQLKAVFGVAILDFKFDDEHKKDTIVSHVQLLDIDNHETFYDKLTYVLIQIPNFNKTIDELKNRLDQWLYTLSHLENFERIPEKLKDKIFRKLFKIAEYQALSKDERSAYEDSLKYYRDLKNSLDSAEEEGYEKAQRKLLPLVEQERKEKRAAKQREQEAKQREQEAKQKEQEAKQKEQEAKQKEQEAKQKEQEAKQKEQEAKQKEQEAKQKEQEAKQKEQEAKQREKEAIKKLAKMMKEFGQTNEEIRKETGLSIKEIEAL